MKKSKTQRVDANEYQIPAYLEELMAAYGITDENMDAFERQREEEEKQAWARWEKLKQEIMANNITPSL